MGHVLYGAGHNLVMHDGIEMAGYLTFLTLLSLFPFLVLVVAVFGFIGQGPAGANFIHFLFEHLPADVMRSLSPRIDEITSGPPQGLLTVAIVGALWTSSSAVEGIRTVLNRAYQVNEPPHFFLRRMVSIAQILIFTVLIILTMLVLVLAPVGLKWFMHFTGVLVPLPIERLFTNDFVFIGAAVLFAGVASLYHVLPNVTQTWRAVLPGAALVVVLWIVGSAGVGFYLKNLSTVNVIYGSLSSLIATLIFFFIMNIIFIYGAEFNHVLFEKDHKHAATKRK